MLRNERILRGSPGRLSGRGTRERERELVEDWEVRMKKRKKKDLRPD